MGLDVGFNFYKKVRIDDVNNTVLLEPINVKSICSNDNIYNKVEESIFVRGRCNCTYAFVSFVERHERDCGEKEYPEVILNDKSLNNFIKLNSSINYEEEPYYSKARLFYQSIDDLESTIDFETEKADHEDRLDEIRQHIAELDKRILELRGCQSKSETDAAFKGFQEEILILERIKQEDTAWLRETEEDDYDYFHAKMLYDDIQEVKIIMEANEDIIITAWCSY